MNPMKWPVWVRIAAVVTVLWMVVGATSLAVNIRVATFIGFLFPVVLFWGVAWIILGISKREIRMRVIKILVRVLIGVPVVFILIIILYQLFFVKPSG
ncbi:MAG: hypothetical protein NT047_05140 [Deltaproteobacteria bacterium]|nr:hypothetical protein [Deltaproteobacteria bacterium]